MQKIVFITNIAAPYQVNFAPALGKYFETQFWFYDRIGNRPAYWKVPLNEHCVILDKVCFKKREKYVAFSLVKRLRQFNPDIVLLGGMSIPSNYIAYRWAKKNNKMTIAFTERFRDKKGALRGPGLYMNFIKWLYQGLDLLMVSDADIVGQFKDTLKFQMPIVASRYSSDIDRYLKHPLRQEKSAYQLIFPNRLTSLYNPFAAIELFARLENDYPEIKMALNNDGELKEECVNMIKKYGLEDKIFFLDKIRRWNDLDRIYCSSDIMILPATFSNGNFTIIEAMASGMGIVISDKVLGVGNLIDNNVNGFKGNESVDVMESMVRKYLADPYLLKRHALINRRKVQSLGAEGTAKLYYEQISSVSKID